jgi:rubrerythrin
MQPDAEHQQHDADLGQLRGDLDVGHKTRRGRTDDDAGQQVTDQRRQLEAMQLKGSTCKTENRDNLKAAFAGESQANRRYLYFAAKADVEGYNDVAALFRSTAEGETGHAHGHLEYLESAATRPPACPSAPPPTT